MVKRSILIASAIIVMAVITFLIVYTYPKQHTFSLDGIRYQLGTQNSDFIEPVSISVDGEIEKSIMGVRTFTGTIVIENETIPVPESARELEIEFDEDGSGKILYGYVMNGIPNQYYYGDIFVSHDFSEVAIMVYAKDGISLGGWSGADGHMITAPTVSRNKALEISNRLMGDYLQQLETLK